MNLPGDDHRYWLRPLRHLPIQVTPMRGELVISYLRRLATANRVETALLIRYLGGIPSHDQMQQIVSHDIGLNPPALARLTLLSGHTSTQLSKTLSIAMFGAPHDEPGRVFLPLTNDRGLFRPCSRCLARHGTPTQPVVRLAERELPICIQHGRTLAAHRAEREQERPLSRTPEILDAARRLRILRRRHRSSIERAFDTASAIISDWQHWPGLPSGNRDAILTRWRDRAARLADVPVGMIRLPHVITRLPETIAFTALFCWNPDLILAPRGQPGDPSPIQFLLHAARCLGHPTPSQLLHTNHPLLRWAHLHLRPDSWWQNRTEPDETIYTALHADDIPTDHQLSQTSRRYRRIRSTPGAPTSPKKRRSIGPPGIASSPD